MPDLVVETPRSNDGHAVGLHMGHLGVDLALVHITGFDCVRTARGTAVAVREQVIAIGAGEIVGLPVEHEVGALAGNEPVLREQMGGRKLHQDEE